MTVGRWLNTYVVDGEACARSGAMRDLMDRIDRSVAAEFAASCEQWLHHAQIDASPAVWRIRDIDLKFAVDVSAAGAADVAFSWTRHFVHRILDIIGSGEGKGVVRFPTRAAYLAQFALDLIGGGAQGKWYYEEFESLSQLAPGRAIVEALAAYPPDGVETMLHLARSHNLERVVGALSSIDARIICETCFGVRIDANRSGSPSLAAELPQLAAGWEFVASPAELSQWSGRLLAIWQEEPLRRSSSSDDHDALRWIVKTAVRFPGADRDPIAGAALTGLLALRRTLAGFHNAVSADRLVRDLAADTLSLDEAIAVAQAAGAPSVPYALGFLARIAGGDPDWAAQAAAVLLRDHRPVSGASEGESMITPLAGAFLVAPSLIELHLDEAAVAAAGDTSNQESAAWLRHIVLAKTVGAARVHSSALCPALRLLSGWHYAQANGPPEFDPLDLAWTHALFASHLLEHTGCEPRCLVAEAIAIPEREDEILLLRDLERSVWLFACACPRDPMSREQALRSAIEFTRQIAVNPSHLLLHSSLASLAGSLRSGEHSFSVVAMDDAEITPDAIAILKNFGCAFDSTLRETPARQLSSSAEEFAWFSTAATGDQFGIARDLVTTVIARAALRAFARRLIGFQSSSPQHLYHNFLEGIGTVRIFSDRIEVELPRTPLALVLQLSGLDRQTYTVPWLDGREICLLAPRE